jgi:AAA+ superfamily predicted ATPase
MAKVESECSVVIAFPETPSTFNGPQGIGKRHSAEALAGELGTSLLAMDLLRIPGANDAGQDPSTGLIRGLCS